MDTALNYVADNRMDQLALPRILRGDWRGSRLPFPRLWNGLVSSNLYNKLRAETFTSSYRTPLLNPIAPPPLYHLS